jgi:hypothetical protein
MVRGLDAQFGQQARRLDHRHAARAIVVGAIARDPAVEMRARHHEARLGIAAGISAMMFSALVFLLWKAASMLIASAARRPLRQTHQAAVILLRHFHRGQRQCLAGGEIIALAMHQLAVAVADLHHRQRALGLQKFAELARKAAVLQLLGDRIGIEARLVELVEIAHLALAQPFEGAFPGFAAGARHRNQHDLARQLALVEREMLFLLIGATTTGALIVPRWAATRPPE